MIDEIDHVKLNIARDERFIERFEYGRDGDFDDLRWARESLGRNKLRLASLEVAG